MRTVGLLLFVLAVPNGKFQHPLTSASTELSAQIPGIASQLRGDTLLEKSVWYAQVIRQIEESEYIIQYNEKSKNYTSPNREQGLRANYTPAGFTLHPRDADKRSWTLSFTTKGVYARNRLAFAPGENDEANPTANSLAFDHQENFSTQYINTKKGIRQNFIIHTQPEPGLQELEIRIGINKGWFVNKVHEKEIHFAKVTNRGYEKKLTYNDLKVWDASGRDLPAEFNVSLNEISIRVTTTEAVYPITIDPISTTANWSVESNQDNSTFGSSLMSAGDVNGDGYSDVIVGAYSFDNGQADEGKVFVYHGSATGLSATASWTMEIDQAGAAFGTSVNTAGDVNGDGYSDVIIGALNYDNGQSDEGKAYVFHGSSAGLSSVAAWSYESDQGSANLGTVASAGDVNGDGYSDVIVGARLMDNGQADEGRVFIFHGSASGLNASPIIIYESDQPGAAMGLAVSSAGDVNADGYSDIIIGANIYTNTFSQEGRVWIYHGSATGLSATASQVLNGGQASMNYGNAVGCAGDVNGDGYSDVAIAAPTFDNGQSNEGKVDVHYGSATGILATAAWTTEGGTTSFYYGSGIHMTGGDFNGDGFSDLLVGCQSYANGQVNEGKVFMYQGSATGLSITADWSIESNLANNYFGTAVTCAGDVNGDGYTDVIAGASGYSNGNSNEGAAFVYHGSPDGISTNPVNVPDDANQAGSNFGVSVASAGDVNGDGYSDVIIGAWLFDDGTTDEGRAFIYHGSAAGLGATYNSILDDANQASAFFGETVACAGDVNGDGFSDVIIGADNFDDAGNNNEGRAYVYHGSASGIITTPASVLDDANQANAYFGVSVACAGDVNADGYNDVIVGAIGITDGANANEGRAYIYHGSATGLSSTPDSSPDDADQAGCYFGWSVAGAGDLNGDGYSDIIVGAPDYDQAFTSEGRVFVYYGAPGGLNSAPSAVLDDGNQVFAQFGICVSSAGDINGDGFSDVIVGAVGYDGSHSDEGQAFVYHGSSGGINTTPGSTPDDADINQASFGISVASAGDVNGDGYSDVIIGARSYDDGPNNDEGRAFVYHGSSSGLSNTPGSTPDDANEASAYFGYSVACAGDINGDGYSDVVIGAHLCNDGASADEGKAYVYYGNNAGGLRNNLRLYNIDLVTPIQRSNIGEGSLFGAGLYGRSSVGRTKGRLTWEIIRQGLPFSGTPITNSTAFLSKQSSWTDLGAAGTELKNQVQKVGFQNKIRTRVEFSKNIAITGQMYGPWRYTAPYLMGAQGMQSSPLPVRFISFSVSKQLEFALLKWVTAEESPGTRYIIETSTDGIRFSVLTTLDGTGASRNNYQWIHTQPATGINYYRIKVSEPGYTGYSATRMLQFDETYAMTIFPQPAQPGTPITLTIDRIRKGDIVAVTIFNSMGQKIWSEMVTASFKQRIRFIPPPLAKGVYALQVTTGSKVFKGKLLAPGG